MKASEAIKATAVNKPEADKKRREEAEAWAKEERSKKRAESTRIRKEGDAVYEQCQRAIKTATQLGRDTAEVPVVTWSADRDKVMMRAIKKLQNDGFSAAGSTNTRFTGVDEWEEDYFIHISWR